MNVMKYAVFAMGGLIAVLGAAVVYGMINPPHTKMLANLPVAMAANIPEEQRNLALPVADFTLLPPAGGYLVAETMQNGQKVIYLINPASMTIHGTLTAKP